jgi:pimeloyl-ACP methyl ester carboxylesterase
MISFGLAMAFSLEMLLFVCVSAMIWEFRLGPFPLGSVIVVSVVVLVIARVLMVLIEFTIAHFFGEERAPEQRIGFSTAISMVVTETFSFLLLFCLLLPFGRTMLVRKRGVVSSANRYPVLLVHGYATNAGLWFPLRSYLRSRGLTNIFTMNMTPKRGDLDDYAQQLAARVHRILTTTRAEKVILVGHGLGGLVARVYVERCGGADHVAKVVSIGTPHHGTAVARIVPGTNTAQIRPDSAWLHGLNRDENVLSLTEHTTISSAHDNVVVPHTSAELGQARNIRLKGQGHFSLAFSKAVGDHVYGEVTAA